MADPRLILHNTNTLGNIADKQERVQDIGTVIQSSPCTEDHESLLGGLALLGFLPMVAARILIFLVPRLSSQANQLSHLLPEAQRHPQSPCQL